MSRGVARRQGLCFRYALFPAQCDPSSTLIWPLVGDGMIEIALNVGANVSFSTASEPHEHVELGGDVAEHLPGHHEIETVDEEAAIANPKPDVGALP